MPLLTGSGLRIDGVMEDDSNAFALDVGFTVAIAQAVTNVDITRRTDRYRRIAVAARGLSAIVIRFNRMNDGATPPVIPIGAVMKDLKITLDDGMIIGTVPGDDTSSAVFESMSLNTTKGRARAEGSFRINFSGPMTPEWGLDDAP